MSSHNLHRSPNLEAEDLVLELADWPRLLEPQALGRLLHRFHHGRWPADEDLDVARGRGQLLLDHVRGDESDAAVPLLGRVVQHIVHPKSVVLGRQRIQVVLEQDVLGVDIRKDQIDFGVVALSAATNDRLDDLQHGRDAGAAGNHAEVPNHVRGVDHGALGALDAHRLADLEGGDVLGDVAGGVRLDEQVEVALVLVRRDGRVRADHLLLLSVDGGAERDVLPDGEAERVRGAREFEAVAVRISLVMYKE
jgi:hypothetical protein